jgi:hypothetical protein
MYGGEPDRTSSSQARTEHHGRREYITAGDVNVEAVLNYMRPLTQKVLRAIQRYATQHRMLAKATGRDVSKGYDAFDDLLERLACHGCLEEWPDPVVAAGERSLLVSWQNAGGGHLELEVMDNGDMEVFALLSDARGGVAHNTDFSEPVRPYVDVVVELLRWGKEVFGDTGA